MDRYFWVKVVAVIAVILSTFGVSLSPYLQSHIVGVIEGVTKMYQEETKDE